MKAPLKVSTGYLVHSLLHVPILSKGEPLGVLSVTNRNSDIPFKEKDEVVLSSLAAYAAVALENADLYLQARQEITERQRVESWLSVKVKSVMPWRSGLQMMACGIGT